MCFIYYYYYKRFGRKNQNNEVIFRKVIFMFENNKIKTHNLIMSNLTLPDWKIFFLGLTNMLLFLE
jgi:hypothetical protein